jgi:GntR family transcriptional regulator, rspAB operon transcriptional repressor
LKKLLEELAIPVDTEERLRNHERANLELHQTIIDASGSRRLADLYNSLNAHIKIARIHSAESGAGRPHDWEARLMEEQREHEAIVSALERKDVAGVKQALRKHIYRAKDALVKSLLAAG